MRCEQHSQAEKWVQMARREGISGNKKADSFLNRLFRIWSGKRDSNSRPQPWQGCALPTELFPLKKGVILLLVSFNTLQ